MASPNLSEIVTTTLRNRGKTLFRQRKQPANACELLEHANARSRAQSNVSHRAVKLSVKVGRDYPEQSGVRTW